VDLDDAERADLESLDAGLAEGLVILDEGKTPGLGRPLGSVSGGVDLLLVAGVGLRSGSAKRLKRVSGCAGEVSSNILASSTSSKREIRLPLSSLRRAR